MNMRVSGPYGEEIVFTKKLSKKILTTKNSIWFVDSFFKKHMVFKNQKNVHFVDSGEAAKSLESFDANLKKLISLNANRQTRVFCVGGGSLGDSIGFLCSVYMRGLRLIMVPTTWLACVDSSIGGKTALNYATYKNIVGTFYPPEQNIYVESLIKTAKTSDAEGEIFKTLILNFNKKWAKDIIESWSSRGIKFTDLQYFVDYKTRTVKKDPKDLKGMRAVLNLGHTLGHALELTNKLSHSEAVKQGLLFSVRWSEHKNLLSQKKSMKFEKLLDTKVSKISDEKLLRALKKDKKSLSQKEIGFVFIGDKGPAVKKVLVENILKEYKRQMRYG